MAVLVRDEWTCQLDRSGCTGVASEVHHTQAREIVGDDARYLLAACPSCNKGVGDPTVADPDPRPGGWW